MRIRLLVLLALWAAPASAADLSKVDRTIGKEPAYTTKTPRYCLLVFGPEAKARVWVVLDGETLYVDRNGNGDLTEPGKRFDNQGVGIEPFEVTVGPDRCKVTSLQLHRGRDELMLIVNVDIVGKYRQYCGVGLVEDRRKAPVAHFHGPLTARLQEVNGVPTDKLSRGDKPRELTVLVGTIDEANGCWVVLENRNFRADVHPVVEVEFPAKQPGGKRAVQRYVLKERC